jgi:hypothetical protein
MNDKNVKFLQKPIFKFLSILKQLNNDGIPEALFKNILDQSGGTLGGPGPLLGAK